MRNQPHIVARLASLAPADCGISAISSYEILTGVAKCASPAVERSKVENLLRLVEQLPFDAAAAAESAQIRAGLEAQGMTIGPYDLLIAGHALARGLTLVTNNTSEFRRVPGLPVEDWQASNA